VLRCWFALSQVLALIRFRPLLSALGGGHFTAASVGRRRRFSGSRRGTGRRARARTRCCVSLGGGRARGGPRKLRSFTRSGRGPRRRRRRRRAMGTRKDVGEKSGEKHSPLFFIHSKSNLSKLNSQRSLRNVSWRERESTCRQYLRHSNRRRLTAFSRSIDAEEEDFSRRRATPAAEGGGDES